MTIFYHVIYSSEAKPNFQEQHFLFKNVIIPFFWPPVRYIYVIIYLYICVQLHANHYIWRAASSWLGMNVSEFRHWNIQVLITERELHIHPGLKQAGVTLQLYVIISLSLKNTLTLFNYTKHKYIIRHNFWCRPSFSARSKWIEFKMTFSDQ